MRVAKINTIKIISFLSLGLFGYAFANSFTDLKQASAAIGGAPDGKEVLGAFTFFEPQQDYDLLLDTFHLTQSSIKENQFLADILLPHNISYQSIHNLAEISEDVWSVKQLRPNKAYTIVKRDGNDSPDFFIYEPSVYKYVVYDLKNPENTKLVEREITKKINKSAGVIKDNLWFAMKDGGMRYDLIDRMEDAFEWSVDFHHLQKGDRFKLIYEEDYIEGEFVGYGDLIGAIFQNELNDYYAIYYENEKHNGFFDLKGQPMKKAFLKSPIKFGGRISSKFGRRKHPILNRMKNHFGTDYAAAQGTPILAVANGVVSKRGHTRNNGYYIKLKHDETYSTQYLHMSRFNKKVKKGSTVKQGDVIGYVGKTGMATGPHVCFRFWKNGKQVNHLKENLPPPDPMPEDELPAYFEVRDSIQQILDDIQYSSEQSKQFVKSVPNKEERNNS